MPNYYLSVLYKHIIQVEDKNVGLKVGGGHKHTIAPPVKKVGGHMPPLPPRFLRQCSSFNLNPGTLIFQIGLAGNTKSIHSVNDSMTEHHSSS